MSATPSLPAGVRLCAILALVLGTCSGMHATSNALTLLQGSEPVARTAKAPETPEQERLLEAAETLQSAHVRAVRPFRGARVLVALLLSVTTMFTLVIALRVLIPAGLSRRPLVRGLSTVMIATAFVRTVDGAMEFAIARKLSKPVMDLMRAQLMANPRGMDAEELLRAFNETVGAMPNLYANVTAFMTLLVAGAFLGIGQYLRSERVAAAFPPPSQDLT